MSEINSQVVQEEVQDTDSQLVETIVKSKQPTEIKGSKLPMLISVLICAFLIPVILVNSILIVKSYTDSDHIPSIFGISPLVVLSGSMSGPFEVDSLIVIKDVEAEDLEVGDIICYLVSGTAVTHRIIEITTDDEGTLAFVTQGDANDSKDSSYVYAEDIEGQYIWHMEEIGAFVMFMQTTQGMIIFIALPIALYLFLDFILSRRDKKSGDKKREELEKELEALKKKIGD